MPAQNNSFSDYVNKKRRDGTKQLKIVEKVLKKQGLKVESFLEKDDDPYIFCYNPLKNSDFDGIRIYKIADKIAFRVQNESETHPFGKAYCIEIEDMFQDFLEDPKVKEEEAGKRVIEAVGKEIRKFFERSAEAEMKDRRDSIEKRGDSGGNVDIRQTGQDFSSLIYNKA